MRYIIAIAALLLGMSLMAYSGVQLSDTRQIYRESSIAYENLRNQVKKSPADHAVPQENISHSLEQISKQAQDNISELPQKNTEVAQVEALPTIYIPKLDIDFEKLKQINKDATAWLYSPDTAIDYPVMRANDYNYYLSHLPDHTKNVNGSLFIDYNSAPDFSDPLTIIYGHHMKSKDMMFGSLKGYKDQKYYDKNPYMYLYTEQKNYRIDLIYGCVIAAGKWREQAFMFAENLEAFLAYAAQNTTFNSGVQYEGYKEGDKIIALSTCSYEFDDARYVVLGILRNEF